MNLKKAGVVTGSRAEYGLLKPLMDALRDDANFQLQVIVTGMHLSPEFGLTYRQIEDDGFSIDEKIDILLHSDTPAGITKSMGLAMTGFGEAFQRLEPDFIVLLGDRFEVFCAAAAAQIFRIKVAHLHGGELTEGAVDDAFRHSITKMSYLHFTSTAEYRDRVIQLGENPDRVFNVGAIGLDVIKKGGLLSRQELENSIGFKLGKENLLVTFHPVTLEDNTAGVQFRNLLDAIDSREDTKIIFTKANADTGGRIINRMIDDYVEKNAGKSIAFASLGQTRYLSALKHVDAVVGNSSSGIIEAPSFRIGTINIGDRQKGRIRAESVIDCSGETADIAKAIRKLYSTEFQKRLETVRNPFGNGTATAAVMNILKSTNWDASVKKRFFDIKS